MWILRFAWTSNIFLWTAKGGGRALESLRSSTQACRGNPKIEFLTGFSRGGGGGGGGGVIDFVC